jgi:hypothetical protein
VSNRNFDFAHVEQGLPGTQGSSAARSSSKPKTGASYSSNSTNRGAVRNFSSSSAHSARVNTAQTRKNSSGSANSNRSLTNIHSNPNPQSSESKVLHNCNLYSPHISNLYNPNVQPNSNNATSNYQQSSPKLFASPPIVTSSFTKYTGAMNDPYSNPQNVHNIHDYNVTYNNNFINRRMEIRNIAKRGSSVPSNNRNYPNAYSSIAATGQSAQVNSVNARGSAMRRSSGDSAREIQGNSYNANSYVQRFFQWSEKDQK